MNAFESVIEDVNTQDFDFIEKNVQELQDAYKKSRDYLVSVLDTLEKYSSTGKKQQADFFKNLSTETPLKKSNESKENIAPNIKEEENFSSTSRPRRNAFLEATQNLKSQTKVSLNGKQQHRSENVYVKLEKLSIVGNEPIVQNVDAQNIKVEKDEMPAPTRPAPKKKKRTGRTKVKQEKIEEEKDDVVIQEVPIPTISLEDSSENADMDKMNINNADNMKRSRTSSEDDCGENKGKRSKSNEEKNFTVKDQENLKVTDATFVAQPSNNDKTHLENVTDATFVRQNLNSTVVVENPKYVNNLMPQTMEDMITDDESYEDINKNTKLQNILKHGKPIFNPFIESPVKKKVEAFEKLTQKNLEIQRITRTKSKKKEKEQLDVDNNTLTIKSTEPASKIKEKSKMFTPVADKFVPKVASTAIKGVSSLSNDSVLSTKNSSVSKSYKMDKDQTAILKRQALLQAQSEEKKQKREQRQLRAQQIREAKENEKQKLLEAQKLKDERYKKLLAEQEEKKQKMKMEHERKRLLAKMKADKEKKKEEQIKNREMTAELSKHDKEMIKSLKKHEQKPIPSYKKDDAPRLPTEDCYDSDEEKYPRKQVVSASWSRTHKLEGTLYTMSLVGQVIKNTFFCIQAQTPDLLDIFEYISPDKLKRSSSANWTKPPRFTMVPTLEDHDETEEFDEDI